jgi:hypothetical protein
VAIAFGARWTATLPGSQTMESRSRCDNPCFLRQVLGEGALARARIAEDEDFHCGLTLKLSGGEAVRLEHTVRQPFPGSRDSATTFYLLLPRSRV